MPLSHSSQHGDCCETGEPPDAPTAPPRAERATRRRYRDRLHLQGDSAYRDSSIVRQALSRATRHSPEPQIRARLAVVHPEAFPDGGIGVRFITADERLAARNGPKILMVGPSGVGK